MTSDLGWDLDSFSASIYAMHCTHRHSWTAVPRTALHPQLLLTAHMSIPPQACTWSGPLRYLACKLQAICLSCSVLLLQQANFVFSTPLHLQTPTRRHRRRRLATSTCFALCLCLQLPLYPYFVCKLPAPFQGHFSASIFRYSYNITPLRAILLLPASALVVSYTPDIRDTTSVRYR